jgi:CRISPR/Cas system-associated exonuclease Cas4 (RecB family)
MLLRNRDSRISDLIESIYAEAERAREKEKKRDYLGASQIGHPCGRYLWFTYNGVQGENPPSGRMLLLFTLGALIEQEVIRRLLAAGYRITDEQTGFTDFDRRFGGHCDGVIHGITEKPHLLEIKSANAASFKAMSEKGVRAVQPKYYCQCQIYMGYLKLTRAVIVVYNKNDSSIYAERFDFNQADFDALRRRAWEIINAKTLPPPPPAFEKENNKDCYFCEYKNLCGGDGGDIADDELISSLYGEKK